MKETYLCTSCGARIDDSIKNCPVCKSLNYRNPELLEKAVEEEVSYQKNLDSFQNKFIIVTLIGGIVMAIVGFYILVSFEHEYIPAHYYKIGTFLSIVASGMTIFFSIYGLIKKEYVMKIVLIFSGIALSLLLSNLFFIF